MENINNYKDGEYIKDQSSSTYFLAPYNLIRNFLKFFVDRLRKLISLLYFSVLRYTDARSEIADEYSELHSSLTEAEENSNLVIKNYLTSFNSSMNINKKEINKRCLEEVVILEDAKKMIEKSSHELERKKYGNATNTIVSNTNEQEIEEYEELFGNADKIKEEILTDLKKKKSQEELFCAWKNQSDKWNDAKIKYMKDAKKSKKNLEKEYNLLRIKFENMKFKFNSLVFERGPIQQDFSIGGTLSYIKDLTEYVLNRNKIIRDLIDRIEKKEIIKQKKEEIVDELIVISDSVRNARKIVWDIKRKILELEKR